MIHSTRRLTQAVSLALATALLGAQPGFAEESRFGQEMLEILRSEGKISDEKYEELKALEEAEHAASQTPPVSAEDDTDFTVKYSNGLQFNRNDGKVKIKLGGRIQADFATIHPTASLAGIEDYLNAPLQDPDDEDPAGNYGYMAGVEFRRARIYMSGDLYDRIGFKTQIDFATGEVKLNDVWISMKRLGPVGTVKVGHFKEPFSLEELMSSKYITFMERSLPSVFDSSRNFGIGANNHHLDQRLTWAAGIFAPTDDQGKWTGSSTAVNLTGRLTGTPLYRDKGEKLVHLGLSVSHQFRDDEEQGYSQRPESHLAQKYLDFDDIFVDGVTLLAAELAWVHGPFSIQAEWKQSWLDQVSDSDPGISGAYAYASYFITGEHRNYKTKNGTFGRVSPNKPFDPRKRQWGAFEVAFRYSWLDLKDKGLNGGEEMNYTIGLNWYLFSNVLMRANYIYADVKDTGDNLGNRKGNISIFQMRAQIEF